MSQKNKWYELIERNENLHGNFNLTSREIEDASPFFQELCNLKEYILRLLDDGNFTDTKHILNIVYSNIYHFIISQDNTFDIFDISTDFYKHIYESLFFTSIGMFLHDTKRIKGKRLTEFIYHNSLKYYDKKAFPNYCSLEYPADGLIQDTISFRKSRHRLLSSRPVFTERSEWSAMSKDSEYEWTLKYSIEAEEKRLQDTFKRIGNLYNDIRKELSPSKDSTDSKRLRNAYTKFLSKVQKIKYENYVDLQKVYLSHICDDKTYYGINIYRYEKENRFYIITNEMKKLTKCKNDDEEDIILTKSSILNNIWFPKIHDDFFSLHIDHLKCYTDTFSSFKNIFVFSSRLIIDEIVEKGYFGNDWETSFISIMNEMATTVFYTFDDLDFSIMPNSQEYFEKLLAKPAHDYITSQIGKI